MNVFEKQMIIRRLNHAVTTTKNTYGEVNFHTCKNIVTHLGIVPKGMNEDRVAAMMVQIARGNTGFLEREPLC